MEKGEREGRLVFPFSAIVGLEKAKLALLCVAVNPLIGGVLLRGDKGTGKSTLVRALANILPEIEVVAEITQRRSKFDTKTYVGHGKVEEVTVTAGPYETHPAAENGFYSIGNLRPGDTDVVFTL